jgi:hypothetical protein
MLKCRAFRDNRDTAYLVVCYYDASLAEAVQYAKHCVAKGPATWKDAGMEVPKEG